LNAKSNEHRLPDRRHSKSIEGGLLAGNSAACVSGQILFQFRLSETAGNQSLYVPTMASSLKSVPCGFSLRRQDHSEFDAPSLQNFIVNIKSLLVLINRHYFFTFFSIWWQSP
jgi:hypothetical protein